MNNLMPCFTDSDENRFPFIPRVIDVQDYADNLMDDCKRLSLARLTNQDGDLYDGDLLPLLMVEIASWTGKDSDERMQKMRTLLADALYKMAEREQPNG